MGSPNDVIVVGAGIIGCAVACELARRGASVEIVDDRPAGMGATQASAGVLAPYIEAREGGGLLDLTVRSLELFDKFVGDAGAAGGVAIGYHRTGTLDVAQHDAAMPHLAEAASLLRARGVAAELVDRRAARAYEPHLAEEIAGGLLIPSHGFVVVADLVRALAAAARRHGAQLIERGRVRRISAVGDDLRVDTDRGSLTGNSVVVAAGSWSGQIAIDGTAPAPIRPVRGQLLQLGWVGDPLKRVTWSERCYMVPWDNGTLLLGATVEEAGFDERTTVAGVRDLIDAATELVPRVWTASLQAARVGLRPAAPDHLPVIGRSAVLPNLVYATGHYRNGVLLAPLTAQLVADLLLDDVADPLLAFTRPDRLGRL